MSRLILPIVIEICQSKPKMWTHRQTLASLKQPRWIIKNWNPVGSMQCTCSVTILLCCSVSGWTGQTALSFLPSTDGFSSLACKQGDCRALCSSSPYEDIFRGVVMLLSYWEKLPQYLKLLDSQCFLLLQLVRPLSALWKRRRSFRSEEREENQHIILCSYLPAGHLLGLHRLHHVQRPFSCETGDKERRDVLINHTFNTPAGPWVDKHITISFIACCGCMFRVYCTLSFRAEILHWASFFSVSLSLCRLFNISSLSQYRWNPFTHVPVFKTISQSSFFQMALTFPSAPSPSVTVFASASEPHCFAYTPINCES